MPNPNDQIEEEVADTPQPELSLREELAQTFEEVTTRAEEPGDTETQTAARQRGQDGRFVPRDAAEPGEVVAADAVAPVDPAAPANAVAVDIPAPISWNAEAKAKWSEVPPEVRKYVAEREEQMHRQISTNDQERSFGRQMSNTLQPYVQTLQEIGVPADRAVAGLLNVDNVLRKGTPEQKLEMVHEIMRSYQIPAEAVFNHQPLPQDPRLNALQQQLQAVQQQLEQGTHQQQTAAEEIAAAREIEVFKASAQHLEVPGIRESMSALLSSGQAASLQDAYDKAVWSTPATRQLMMAQQTAADTKTRRVASARAAGSSLSGAPGGVSVTPAAGNRSLRDELKANFSSATAKI